MTPTKLLIGQIIAVFVIVLAGVWLATQWAAAELAYQPELGPPWFVAFGRPIYLPWLNRRGASELEDRFALRLDRMTAAIGRLERDGHIQLETLALFVRYELAIQAPLAENDQAGRAIAAKRFEAFIAQVGRQIATGRRTIADGFGGGTESGQ